MSAKHALEVHAIKQRPCFKPLFPFHSALQAARVDSVFTA
jgi:hypothetical protein